jgi:hypothetical protein
MPEIKKSRITNNPNAAPQANRTQNSSRSVLKTVSVFDQDGSIAEALDCCPLSLFGRCANVSM